MDWFLLIICTMTRSTNLFSRSHPTLLLIKKGRSTDDDDAGSPPTARASRWVAPSIIIPYCVIKHWYTDKHSTSSAFSQPTTPPETIVYIDFLWPAQSACFSFSANQIAASIYLSAFNQSVSVLCWHSCRCLLKTLTSSVRLTTRGSFKGLRHWFCLFGRLWAFCLCTQKHVLPLACIFPTEFWARSFSAVTFFARSFRCFAWAYFSRVAKNTSDL